MRSRTKGPRDSIAPGVLARASRDLTHERIASFAACSLAVVASGAQRLPVVTIPEQGAIAPVGYPVVNDGSWREAACPLALGAQRMCGEECGARLAPCVTVAPLRSGPPFDPREARAGVRWTVPPFDEGGTSWVIAAARCTSRQQKSRW